MEPADKREIDETAESQAEEQTARLAHADKLYQTGMLLIYGRKKLIDKAIKCIQRAINLNEHNYSYWQLLGEAYYQRGSLNPAINCFRRSLSLAEQSLDDLSNDEKAERISNRTYSMMRMSDIRLSVGHLDEALSGYSDIIEKEPSNTPALIGFARTNLQLARNNFSAGLVKLGHSHCMTALESSLKAIKLCPNLCLTWKLAADCCLIQFLYGQRSDMSMNIEIQFPGSTERGLLLDRYACLELAQKFLCKSLTIEGFGDSVSLWHNLGITLYLMSSQFTKAQDQDACLKQALRCLLKALSCDKNNSQVKNSIGVVTFHLNLLQSAQTFLIKSIQSNLSTSEIQFSNLGYIYLQKGEFRLASVAFSRCQAEEPLYFRSWLGKALVNEQHNVDSLPQLRHCHKLENNYESQVMYACKVSSLPHLENYLKDVFSALDCSKRIINYDKKCLELNNSLGLLYERTGFDEASARYFNIAYQLQPNNSRVIMNRLRHNFPINSSCIDDGELAREEDDFIKTAEKLSRSGNKEYILNYIYFLFKSGNYSDISDRMTRLMERLDPRKVHEKIGVQILLALAVKAENRDYKSWLFKNIIDSQDRWCVELLINNLSLMILGKSTDDTQIVDLVSKNMTSTLITYLSTQSRPISQILGSSEGFWIHFVILCSIFCLEEQTRLVQQLVALFPTVAEFWVLLGLSFIVKGRHPDLADFCIDQVNRMDSTSPDLKAVGDMLMAVSEVSGKKQESVRKGRLVMLLSRATYKCPQYGLLWTLLLNLNSQDRTNSLGEEIRNLFNLAIDHMLKAIST